MATDINTLKLKIKQKSGLITASEIQIATASGLMAQISGIYTDQDYLTISSNRVEFLGELILAFADGAGKEIAAIIEDGETPSSAQLEFYKANSDLFNDDQKDIIDTMLIMDGDLSNISFPRQFVESKSQFERLINDRVDAGLDAAAQITASENSIMKRSGGFYRFEGSDERLEIKVFLDYQAQLGELTSRVGLLENGEMSNQKPFSLSTYTIKDPADNSFWASLFSSEGQEVFNGSAILDQSYKTYVAELIEERGDFEDPREELRTTTEIKDENVEKTSERVLRALREYRVYFRRLEKFEEFTKLSPTQEGADPQKAQELLDNANKNLNSRLTGFGDGAEQDSPIDLEARQKVFEQCALLSDIKGLSGKYLKLIKEELYSPRLYLVETNDSDSASNMNRLLLPMKEDIKSFLQITPDVAAMLVPKIRLFLVREIDGVTTKKEFKFPTSTAPNIESIFRGTPTGKGTEFGIKSFSFSFEGTNPATARNDITADLTLFFQNFNDFVSEEHDPKFVDLILYDKGKEKTAGFNAISKNQYSPDYYRILAEVGWQIPTDKSIIKEIEKRVSYKSLKNALRKTNKSFYLNMVEHDMDFKEDGTFEVKAQYRAYIESALKGPDFDALATPDILKRRFQRENQVEKLIESGVCNTEGLQQLARAFEVEDLEMIKDSYQSIISRLLCRDRIFVGKPKDEDINTFSRFGYFKKPCGWREDPIVSSKDAPEAVLAEATSTQKSTVNFFFLGDLIYTILDSAYELGEGSQFNRPFKNTNVVLFPFEIQDMEGKTIQLNIAEIPISVDFFIEWYTDNVIAVERKTYPIMNFIRDLTNKLVVDLLAEQCRYQPLENKFRFNTATIMAKGTDPLGRLTSNGTKKLDIAKEYAASPPNLPLNTDDEKDSKFSDYHNYIIIYPVYSNIQHLGTGSEVDDGKRGTYHFDIGPSKGLVKRIKFSKVDMQYIREARFMQQGTQNLAQLAAVYKASIDMIGNTIYYPGMEVFINPRGLGIQGDPTTPGSVANVLGFGGYHLVTRVNSNISPSSFSTNIEAMFTYSGDGTPPLTISNLNQNNETKPIEDSAPTQACNDVIVVAESNAIKLFEADALDYENLQDINQKQAVPEGSAQAIPEDQ
jgi:hypothetical protein